MYIYFFHTLFQTHSTILQYNLLNQITLLYTTYTTFQIDYIKLLRDQYKLP